MKQHRHDRLNCGNSDLLQIVKRLEEISAGFRSLTEATDTTTPVGRMLTQVLGSFAEFEREMIRERTSWVSLELAWKAESAVTERL